MTSLILDSVQEPIVAERYSRKLDQISDLADMEIKFWSFECAKNQDDALSLTHVV